MPNILTPYASDALSADGAGGYVTVASNVNYYPGAHVWLSDNGANTPTEYVVTDLSGATKIGLQAVAARNGSANYTRGSVTQWTVAHASKITQDAKQLVQVDNAQFSVKMPLI